MAAKQTMKISFRQDFEDVYNYLKAQENASLLIGTLVKAHMDEAVRKADFDQLKQDINRHFENLYFNLQNMRPISAIPTENTLKEAEIEEEELDEFLNFV